MPGIAKQTNVIGLVGKEETVNGTPVALSNSADGMRLWLDNRDGIPLSPSYGWDGFLSEAPGGLGAIGRARPQAKACAFEPKTYFQGAGVAYEAAVVSSLHKWLKMAGHTATLDATSMAEKWTYAPTLEGAAFTTLCFNAYTRKELWPLSFGIANWRYEFDSTGMVRHFFPMQAVCGATSDAALPSITYPLLTVQPPTAAGMVADLGDYTLVGIKRGSWDMGRVIETRGGIDHADAHLGYGPRDRKPVWSIEVEQTAFVTTPFHDAAGFNPWALWENQIQFPFSLRHPGAQYNRWLHASLQAQLKAPPEMTSVAGVACVRLMVEPILSTPVANDDYIFETD